MSEIHTHPPDEEGNNQEAAGDHTLDISDDDLEDVEDHEDDDDETDE